MTDKIDAAKRLAAQGFRVFPLGINAKVPALDGNWQKLATTDPDRIDSLWRCPVFGDPLDYNIGVALGPDDVVIDVDVRDGKRGAESLRLWEAINDPLPVTYEVTTASGGRHLYFKSELSGNFPAKLADGIDIKDHRDFVVGPGSEIDGGRYVQLDHAQNGDQAGRTAAQDARPLPTAILETATSSAPKVRSRNAQATVLVDLDSPAAVNRAVEWLRDRAPDHGTYTVAARVKDMGVSESRCLELMLEHWPPAAAKGEEHVGFRVENAYRYGQNAPGVASAEAEFEAVEIDVAKPQPRRRGLYFVPWEEAKPDLNRPYLIDDVIDAGAMVVVYGDSNAGKTYVMLDMAFCIAAGREWNGHKVHQGLVVYVAAEGGGGFARRIEAFRRHYDAEKVPFALVPCPIDLQSDNADTGKLIRVIREAEAHYGQTCVMVVVDTLARAMSGGDENTAVDMGKFVGHCDRIRAATGAATPVVHHTGKDASKGARGSSALRAATDTEIEVGGGQVAIKKQRDMAAGAPASFGLETIEIGERHDGKRITACVVQWIAENEFEVRISPLATQFLGLLRELMAARADMEEGDNADISVPWNEWQMSSFESLTRSDSGRVSKPYLYKLRGELVTAGLVRQTKQKQWLTVESH